MQRLIVAITGASGAVFGIRTLQVLRELDDVETHLILTKGARATIAQEVDLTVPEIQSLADVVHPETNLGAAISSGSFPTLGMIVAPCSIKALSGIANSFADNLVIRAADVVLKERRRLVLLVRETPLHAGHLRLMQQATENGAIVMPPVPAFYHRPTTIEGLVDQAVGRALDLFGLPARHVQRWTGHGTEAAPSAEGRSEKLDSSMVLDLVL